MYRRVPSEYLVSRRRWLVFRPSMYFSIGKKYVHTMTKKCDLFHFFLSLLMFFWRLTPLIRTSPFYLLASCLFNRHLLRASEICSFTFDLLWHINNYKQISSEVKMRFVEVIRWGACSFQRNLEFIDDDLAKFEYHLQKIVISSTFVAFEAHDIKNTVSPQQNAHCRYKLLNSLLSIQRYSNAFTWTASIL